MASDELPEIPDLVAVHGPFLLKKTGVESTREATYDEWLEATTWALDTEKASPWWIAALIEYGEHRYGEKYSQALESTGYALQTLKNSTLVHRKIPLEERRADVPFSHHAEVASLPTGERKALLDRCADEGLSREHLRQILRANHATAQGEPVTYLLSVTCTDEAHMTALADELRLRPDAVVAVRTKVETASGA